MVNVQFFAIGGSASGTELTGDMIYGMYHADGFGEPIVVGQAQGITYITTSGGVDVASDCNNNKWVDASGVSLNGAARVDLSTIVESGDATMLIRISDAGTINVSGAKLYAYDTNDVNNDPSGIWVLSYEIIPTERSGLGDTEWALIDSTNYNYMVDRTPDVGYEPSGEFNYHIGLSTRPKLTQSSGLQNFGLYFVFDYS